MTSTRISLLCMWMVVALLIPVLIFPGLNETAEVVCTLLGYAFFTAGGLIILLRRDC